MNLSNLILLLLQGGAGAVSGYVTNKYAVNMLFKEYTPFKIFDKVLLPAKFGGVIKNRKEQFIEEISELVERDIINSDTILANFNNENFEKVLNEIVKEFFNEELKKLINNMEFRDIHNYESIIDNILCCFTETLKVNSNLVDKVINEIDFNDDITFKVTTNICEKFIREIEEEVAKTNFTSDCIKELYGKISEENISEILCYENLDLVEKNITVNIEKSINNLFSNDEIILNILNNLHDKIDTKSIIIELQKNLYNKTLSDYITEEELDNICDKLFDVFMTYLNSDNGKSNFKEVSSFALNIIKDMDYTIYDILPEDSSKKLTEFINNSIHKMMPYFSEWINKNKDEFDVIIENSIDEAIGSLDPGIKKMIISKVRALFLDNVSAKNQIVEKITNYIENYNIDENSIDEICDTILNYLRNTKISEIVESLQKTNIIENSQIENLFGFLKEQCNIHGRSIIYNLLNMQMSKTFKVLLKRDLDEIFECNIKQWINDLIITNKQNINNILLENLKTLISSNFQDFKKFTLSSIIDKETLTDNIEKINEFINKILNENKNILCHNMSSYLINGLTLLKNSEKAKDEIYKSTISIVKVNLLDKGNSNVYDVIYDNLCKDEVYESVTKVVKDILVKNLDSMLKGKVKGTIRNNLMQYDEDEICDLAQRFMGNELKPLSMFGGVLGFICGILFGLVFKNISINGFYSNMSEQILSILLMGFVGIITNVIAINMLFKPYTKNKFLSKIPFIRRFALGYIPAHKDNMSSAIGNVIDNDLLNRNYLYSILKQHKENIKIKLFETAEKNDFKIVSDFIISQKNITEKSLNKIFFNYFINNKNKAIEKINSHLMNTKINENLIKKQLIDDIIEKAKIEEKIKEISFEYLENIIKSSHNVEEFILPEAKDKLGEYFNRGINKSINNIGNKIESIQMESIICEYVINIIKNKEISNKIIDNISYFISKNSKRYIINSIENSGSKLTSVILKDENTIETILNGKIKVFIDKNLFKLTEFAIYKIKILLIDNENFIKDNIKVKIGESLNFFEKMGYAMAGGDDIVDRAVNIMIHKNMPVFISDRFFEITNIIKDSFDNYLYKVKINEICSSLNEDNVNKFICGICENLNNNEYITRYYEGSINILLHSVLNNIDEEIIKTSVSKFDKEFCLIQGLISENIKNKEVSDYVYRVSEDYVIQPIYNMEMKNIFKEYDLKNMKHLLNNISNKLEIEDFLKEKTFELMSVYIKNKRISNIVDKSIAQECLISKYTSLFDNSEFIENSTKIISDFSEILIRNEKNIFNYNTKSQIIDILCDSSLDSFINNSSNIIESIKLKAITKNQIELMNPKELHELFLSFSGTLFKKLYLYGAFGAVFGINLWIPVILGIKESIDTSNSNSDIVEEH